jgi:hypothetical protein
MMQAFRRGELAGALRFNLQDCHRNIVKSGEKARSLFSPGDVPREA